MHILHTSFIYTNISLDKVATLIYHFIYLHLSIFIDKCVNTWLNNNILIDGSETTEDQQLLDRDSGTGEYPPMVEPGAQLGYGTFYDHASGYYYEYPVMLVGPAPVPTQVGPSVLATVPCGPVPLRPIEWINPAFVPKLANQPYCLMDYQVSC